MADTRKIEFGSCGGDYVLEIGDDFAKLTYEGGIEIVEKDTGWWKGSSVVALGLLIARVRSDFGAVAADDLANVADGLLSREVSEDDDLLGYSDE